MDQYRGHATTNFLWERISQHTEAVEVNKIHNQSCTNTTSKAIGISINLWKQHSYIEAISTTIPFGWAVQNLVS